VAVLAKAHAEGRLEERLGFFAKPKLLIIDELGYLPFETNAAHLFFQLVSRRYERGSLLITSNRAVGEWGSVFGDPVVATAILDRLLHHSHVITIRDDSYRVREKRRSGLIKATLSDAELPGNPVGGMSPRCTSSQVLRARLYHRRTQSRTRHPPNTHMGSPDYSARKAATCSTNVSGCSISGWCPAASISAKRARD